MSKISGPDCSVVEMERDLKLNGLALIQPCVCTTMSGVMWVIVNLKEIDGHQVFTGEGSFIWDAINAAFQKATKQGLRNSRLS